MREWRLINTNTSSSPCDYKGVRKMTDLRRPTAISLVPKAQAGDPDAAAYVLQYAADEIENGDLPAEVTSYVAMALKRAIKDPGKASRALGLTGKQNRVKLPEVALRIRNTAISDWAESKLIADPKIKDHTLAKEFLGRLRPDNGEIDWGFVNQIHEGEFSKESTQSLVEIVRDKVGCIAIKQSNSKELRASLVKQYEAIGSPRTVAAAIKSRRIELEK